MRIALDGIEFNRIMHVTVPALSKDENRPELQYIKIETKIETDGQGHGCATALNGYTCAQTCFFCEGDSGEMLLPKYKAVRDDCIIEILREGDTVSISDGREETRFHHVPDASKYVDHASLARKWEEGNPIVKFAINPKLLRNALKSYEKQECAVPIVIIEIYGKERAIIGKITPHLSLLFINRCGVIFPIRVSEDYYKRLAFPI